MILKPDEELVQVAVLVPRDDDRNFLDGIPLYRIKKRGAPDGDEAAFQSFAMTMAKIYRAKHAQG